MGYFKNLETDVIEMYSRDGMKEMDIAHATGLKLTEVHDILSKYDNGDFDYDINDTDAGEMISYDDLIFDPEETDYNAEHY
jgi:hypothetical protein